MLSDDWTYEGSALHIVIRNTTEELAWMLIAVGIDINLTSSEGSTALHLTSQQRYFDLACELIEARCALKRFTREGKTELHSAVEARSVEVVGLLLSIGVEIDLRGPSS